MAASEFITRQTLPERRMLANFAVVWLDTIYGDPQGALQQLGMYTEDHRWEFILAPLPWKMATNYNDANGFESKFDELFDESSDE